jgi:hypothetical protein
MVIVILSGKEKVINKRYGEDNVSKRIIRSNH